MTATRGRGGRQADRRRAVRGRPPPRRGAARRARRRARRGGHPARGRRRRGPRAARGHGRAHRGRPARLPPPRMPAAVLTLPFTDDRIPYEGWPVAIVLGESVEAAEAARAAVVVDCAAETPVLLGAGERTPAMGEDAVVFDQGRRRRGPGAGRRARRADLRAGRAAPQHDGDVRRRVARLGRRPRSPSGTPCRRVRPSSRSSARRSASTRRTCASSPRTPAAASAPRATSGRTRSWPPRPPGWSGRPVKLHLRRADQFSDVGYQPWMEQTVRLAADADGVLLGVEHEVVNNAGLVDTHVEPATEASKSLYAVAVDPAAPADRAGQPQRAHADAGPRRGAGAVGAGERDERAGRRGRDRPARRAAGQLRRGRRPPTAGRGRATGCARRTRRGRAATAGATGTQRPRQDGPWRIGHGMATCSMGSFRFPGAAPGAPAPDGGVSSRATCTTSAAARRPCCPDRRRGAGRAARPGRDALGRHRPPAHRAHLRLVDHDGHRQRGRGGRARRRQAAGRPRDRRRRPGAMAGRASTSSSARARTNCPAGQMFNGDGEGTPYAMRTWGAIFVEVGVDPDFGLLRLRRAVGVYSAGRIVNALTARAQMIGGDHLGLGQGDDGGERPGAGVRAVAGQEPVQRGRAGQRRHPGRHRRVVRRRVRRGGEPDRGAGHR